MKKAAEHAKSVHKIAAISGFSLDQSQQINHLTAAGDFGEGQPQHRA